MVNKTTITDNQDELLIEVDSNNQVLGSIPRGEAHNNPDIIYRTIFILVKDKEGKILLQKRSSTKDLYPDCWDLSVGGHVRYGESYIEAAVKELQEELGIKASKDELHLVGEVLVKLPRSNEFFHVYEYSMKPSDTISLQTEEVSTVKWVTLEELKSSILQSDLKWYPRPVQVIEALYK